MNELAEPFPVSTQAISKHLRVLEQAGLVTRGRDAQHRPAQLKAEPLGDATAWLEHYRQFWQTGFNALSDHLRDQQKSNIQ